MAGPCGDWAYGWALRWNDLLFAVRKQLGLPYWSLSAWLKHKIKNAVEYISRFEEIVAHEAHLRGVDGVVCGHIHHAEIARSATCFTSTTETGLKAAPPLSKMPTAYGDSSLGRSFAETQRKTRKDAPARTPARPRPRLYPLEPSAWSRADTRRGGPFEDR